MDALSSQSSPIPDLVHDLQKAIAGEVRIDLTPRLLYSTDASIYQIEPLGVVFPRTQEDLAAAVQICTERGVPVLARGAGSSLGGQAVGKAMILDCSRYLNRLVEIDPQAQTATVEPGLVLAALNRQAGSYGLQFGPDPASAERATLGGSLSNNAAGAHSISYGMSADHLLSVDVALSDGSLARLEELSLEAARRKAETPGGRVEAALYRAALNVREHSAGAIKTHWPRTWRRASGYNLDRLLPWSPSQPPQWGDDARFTNHASTDAWRLAHRAYPPVQADHFNLAALIAGSEGTLAVIRQAVVRLVPLPQQTILAVLAFRDMAQACGQAPAILERSPSAIELIPHSIIQQARSVPAYAVQLAFLDELQLPDGRPPTLLVVEFANHTSEDQASYLKEQANTLRSFGPLLLAETPAAQNQIWGVRKAGLGILMSRAGDVKPWPSIEDLTVPVERLAEFAVELQRLMEAHGLEAEVYGHASAGCLHIRPLVSLKTPQGVGELRAIATEAVELTLRLGGSASGEHGDGLARSEWYGRMFGEEILAAFRQVKLAADPHGLLNPGKMVRLSADPHGLLNPGKMVRLSADQPPPAMDEDLRFGEAYRASAWKPAMDFSSQAGLEDAIEQCNGAGVCRKADGVMCPSFQATQDEMHSTRGRANLLRAMISGKFPSERMAEEVVHEALDLCLACKGCKAECPSAVDMAKLKYEFIQRYYTTRRRKLRDYLFGYIGILARLGQPFAPLANLALSSPVIARLSERWLGLAHQRPFPRLARRSLRAQLAAQLAPGELASPDPVIFLSDAFTEYFFPEVGLAAVSLLRRAGCEIHCLPVVGAGRTLISKGFLEAARKQARRVVQAIAALDPAGEIPVVGVEPSEIYTLCDEYLDLLPGDGYVKGLAERAFTIEEFLARPAGRNLLPDKNTSMEYILGVQKYTQGVMRIAILAQSGQTQVHPNHKKVILHGHCYQKARQPAADGYPVGVEATATVLRAAGYEVDVIQDGCCGVAGAFGYEVEHYAVSMKVGELALLPAVRQAGPEDILAAAGVSCRSQIEDGAGRSAVHPLMLL